MKFSLKCNSKLVHLVGLKKKISSYMHLSLEKNSILFHGVLQHILEVVISHVQFTYIHVCHTLIYTYIH